MRRRRQEQNRTLVCRTSLLQPHSQPWQWSQHLWEGGRCSVPSPSESFAGKRLFPSKLCLAFCSCGFGIPLPAVMAAPSSPPCPVPALRRRSSCSRTSLKASPLLSQLHGSGGAGLSLQLHFSHGGSARAPLKGELLQLWRGRCSVQPEHPPGNEPPNAAAGDEALPRRLLHLASLRSHRDQLGNGRISPLFIAFPPFIPYPSTLESAQAAGVRAVPSGPMGWGPGTREEEESKRRRCWNIIRGQCDFIILT